MKRLDILRLLIDVARQKIEVRCLTLKCFLASSALARRMTTLVLVSGTALLPPFAAITRPVHVRPGGCATDTGLAGVEVPDPTFNFDCEYKLIDAVAKKFGLTPGSLTNSGTRLDLLFVKDPHSHLATGAQRAQALAIARFAWRLPQRSKKTDTISVVLRGAARTAVNEGKPSEHVFLSAELNDQE